MPNPDQLGYVPEEYRQEGGGQDNVPEHKEHPEEKEVDRKENREDLELKQNPAAQYEQLRQEGWTAEYPTVGIPEKSRPSFMRTRIINGLRHAGNEVRVTPFYDEEGRLVEGKLQIWTRLKKEDEPKMGD